MHGRSHVLLCSFDGRAEEIHVQRFRILQDHAGFGVLQIYSLSEILDPDLPQHYPRFQILGRAKLSCVAYNSYIKSKLVAADTDGLIVILDGSNGQLGVSHEEHTRTVRSVDFSRVRWPNTHPPPPAGALGGSLLKINCS